MKRFNLLYLVLFLPFITIIVLALIFAIIVLSPLAIIVFLWLKLYDKKYKMYRDFFQKMSKLNP